MNYYIQGNKDKSEQIKAAFEKLGARVPIRRSCADDGLIYFLLGGEVFSITIKAIELFEDNPDYKELELPIQPKFKVGDEIKTGNTIETIAEVGHATRSYYCESGRTIYFANQDLWHLVPKPHYDISNFKPFDKVLMRFKNNDPWRADFFSHIKGDRLRFFVGVGYVNRQCIPFNDDTKHLLGTTDMCDEMYINW